MRVKGMKIENLFPPNPQIKSIPVLNQNNTKCLTPSLCIRPDSITPFLFHSQGQKDQHVAGPDYNLS